MYYLRINNDPHKRVWKVRQAVSLSAALSEISFAMATGSVGGRTVERDYATGAEKVLSDVVRVGETYKEVRPS